MKKNIVAIGGGTGLSIILRSLKDLDVNISAVVSMADDGGSSGLLRADLNSLPPGDLRNCIVAMSQNDEKLENLFNYRFSSGVLKGHNLGNLIIAALEDITGGMENAVKAVEEIFNISGKVLPVTLESVHIKAELQNSREVIGESAIALQSILESSPIKQVELIPGQPMVYEEAESVIKNADIIIIAPGSLFTSIIPALLVSGVKEAILESKAKCFFVSNLMTQPGETDNYKLRDHIKKIISHLGFNIIDCVIANNIKLSVEETNNYTLQRSIQILPDETDLEYLKSVGIDIYQSDLIEISSGFIRHDNQKVEQIFNRIIKNVSKNEMPPKSSKD